MNYVIADTLIYSTEDGSIRLAGSEDESVVILTPILNRMLQFLLENQGKLITRDRFLEHVWDRHGKMGSANTLKQYISMLRKILAERVQGECIITIPRQGYIFSPDISIRRDEASNVVSELITHHGALAPKAPSVEPQQKNSSGQFYLWISISGCALIAIFFLLYSIMSKPSLLNVYPVAKVGECAVNGFSKYTSQAEEDKFINNVSQFLKHTGMTCAADDGIYYYTNARGRYSQIGMYSILVNCSSKNTQETGCVTYRTNRW